MKKILALLLAVLMVMSFAACGAESSGSINGGDKSNETTAPEGGETTAPEGNSDDDVEAKPISLITISITNPDYTQQLLMANKLEDGTVSINVTASFCKIGEVDASAMDAISKAFATSGLLEMEGSSEDDYADYGASIFVYYEDEESFYLDLYGDLPEAFTTAFAAMENTFKEVTADLPDYVAKPLESGEIADSDRAALDAILSNMTLMGPADSYAINGILKDEGFAYAMSISSDAGIASGLQFTSMNMTTAYTLNIVTLEAGADANTVAANFEAGIDWTKWICVQPESALIATKGNQALLLLGTADMYDNTVAAIEAAGWTTYKTLANANSEEF